MKSLSSSLTPLANRAKVDADFDAAVFDYVQHKKSKAGPTMDLYGPCVARVAWTLCRTIDWTHQHHEQTYDIMASQKVAWDKKKEWTNQAVKIYLARNKDVARSVAPLDVTLRRAACLMKPYFTYYRTYYPKSNSEAWVARWWHPAVYEAQMIGGNGAGQDSAVNQVNRTMFARVYPNRPQRMILSRELMPRYPRISPESANIFDNLHLLHGLAYDILSYEGWTEQQRDELHRVIAAMSYQPGDEKYTRKFDLPYPDVDPRRHPAWMAGPEGGLFILAVALAGTLALPTGLGSYGTDYGGTFILTKSILPMLGLHRLHTNLVYRHNSQPQARLEEGEPRLERQDYWALRAGYPARILPLTLLMLDFVREQRPLSGQLGSSIEVSLRRQMNPRMVLSIGGAAGAGTDADKYRVNVAIQQSF